MPQESLEKILDKGFALVSIDYRLATEEIKYPLPVTDCKDTLRWLRKNARQLNLDPNRIALWGVSAGGYLALLAGLTPEHMFIDDDELVDYSSEVNAIIFWAGSTDFLFEEGHSKKAEDIAQFFLGGSVEDIPEIYQEVSPINYLQADSAPIYLVHGNKDSLVPYAQSEKFHTKGKTIGAKVDLLSVQNADHGFPSSKIIPITPNPFIIIEMCLQFFAEHL